MPQRSSLIHEIVVIGEQQDQRRPAPCNSRARFDNSRNMKKPVGPVAHRYRRPCGCPVVLVTLSHTRTMRKITQCCGRLSGWGRNAPVMARVALAGMDRLHISHAGPASPAGTDGDSMHSSSSQARCGLTAIDRSARQATYRCRLGSNVSAANNDAYPPNRAGRRSLNSCQPAKGQAGTQEEK